MTNRMKFYIVAEMNEDGSINDRIGEFDDRKEAFKFMGEFMSEQDIVVNLAVLEYEFRRELGRITAFEDDA